MDKVDKLRSIVQEVLENYTEKVQSNSNTVDTPELQLLMDNKRDHYQVLLIGWENRKRVYAPIFHLDIKNEKIWVQQNVSDFDLVQEIMDRGVSPTEIVLAFQSSLLRQHSGFAVA